MKRSATKRAKPAKPRRRRAAPIPSYPMPPARLEDRAGYPFSGRRFLPDHVGGAGYFQRTARAEMTQQDTAIDELERRLGIRRHRDSAAG